MKKYKIGILGVGKMGRSLLDGIIRHGLYKKENILLYDTDFDCLNELADNGFEIAEKEVALYQSVEIIILAIKPQHFLTVMNRLQDSHVETTVVSIAAGITINFMKSFLGNQKYIRVMPNTPVAIGYGTSVIARDINVDDQTFITVKSLFEQFGIVEEVKEEEIDYLIPLNGSMPAYLYFFASAFIKAAVEKGINEDLAKKILSHSIIGACHMILQSEKSLDALIDEVCSPGGTTIAGLEILKKEQFIEIIIKASQACSQRSKELEQ